MERAAIALPETSTPRRVIAIACAGAAGSRPCLSLEAQTDPHARDKARTAYQNFLTLWKDADPDIPIYQQAKAEYEKLQ